MKKIEFSIATNRIGSKCKEIIEFEDGATEEEIDEVYQDWMNENNQGSWYVVDSND